MAMENARWAMTAVVVAVLVSMAGAEAATDCQAALASVTGCVSFLTNPSSTPDEKTCCQPLESVLDTPSSFQCLCAQASNSESDVFKNALNLPKACKLDINVSEANCTSSATTPSTGTPTTPSSSNVTTIGANGSGGFISASPLPYVMAIAFLCAAASLF
ncbi:hypothetical protein GOP47_0029430 [Adiantum capillus-veneris]|nr:hypothetical protein GOP47_0029430 [Adiantum capillus-veneris]